ncbi:MAG: DUF6273 domain-containing protein [Bacillota bacterium]
MKRILSTILAILVLSAIATLAPVSPQTGVSALAAPTLKIGDYMTMGKYNDEPILWRCVDIDENGPLMLSDRILTLKPFDARGTSHKYSDGSTQADLSLNDRALKGSNLWETSNIRSWLNSSATAGGVIWPDGCPPDAANVFEGWNAYASEKGFLSEGNFTAGEITAIKSVKQKQLLNELDQAKLKTNGSIAHINDISSLTFLQNYDTAYSYMQTDKMFLLDVKQLSKLNQNTSTFGADYYKSKPTQKAVDKSGYKDSYYLNANSYWYYWLRTPFAASDGPFYVRNVSFNGSVNSEQAGSFLGGVRPAFYLDLHSAIFKSDTGVGSESAPYIFGEDALSTPVVALAGLFGLTGNNGLLIIIIAGAVILLLVIAIIGFLILKKKKKAAVPLSATPEAWTGYVPGAGEAAVPPSYGAPEAVAPPVASPSETAPVAAPPAVAYCASCGTPQVAGFAFCTKCGAKN